MKNIDGMAVAMTVIGALMRRLRVEQVDLSEQELNEVNGTVTVESLPGKAYLRVDLRPEAGSVD